MNGYVFGGWGAAALLIVLYSWRMLWRGRALNRRLPGSTDRRWR